MEKDIGKIEKNPETSIVIRIDDFGGRRGLTIREFVKSEKYTGFTKSGTRIPSEEFENFKKLINSINANDLKNPVVTSQEISQPQTKNVPAKKFAKKEKGDEDSGMDEEGLM